MEKTRDIAILLPMGCTPQKKEDRVGLPVSTNAINPELLCGGSVVITEQAAQSLTTSHLPVETVDAFFLFEQRVPGAPVLSSFVFLDTTPKKTVLRRCSGQILVASDDKPSEDGFRPMPPFDCVPDYPCGNFVRPHGALKFGREIRTPAMQAGLTTRRLTFRDIFLATTIPLWSRIEVFLLTGARNPVFSAPVPLPAAA